MPDPSPSASSPDASASDRPRPAQTTSTTHVAVVEDVAALREALRMLFDGAPGFACVGAYGSAEEALAAARDGTRTPPDVVLLDIGLPRMSGTEAIAALRAAWPGAEVLMHTVFDDGARVFEALCAGASGYLLKHTPPADLLAAVAELRAGGAPMSPSVARRVVGALRHEAAPEAALSMRERAVLALLVDGHTNRQIAEALFVSPHTVGFHVRAIYEKLHVHSRAALVARVLRR